MPHDRLPLSGRVLQPGGLAGGSVQGPYRVLSQSSLQQTVNAARGQVRGASRHRHNPPPRGGAGYLVPAGCLWG